MAIRPGLCSILLALALAACGAADPGAPTESTESGSTRAPGHDAFAIGEPMPAETAHGTVTPPRACAGDRDCASHELCVVGVCRAACRSDADCAGATCDFGDQGWCYNAPGCNPPPPGYVCSTSCWGYCVESAIRR